VPQGICASSPFGYSRALSWLLAISVAILVVPVSLQIFSRYTALSRPSIWTEEMGAVFFRGGTI